jgi:hypothetical protein
LAFPEQCPAKRKKVRHGGCPAEEPVGQSPAPPERNLPDGEIDKSGLAHIGNGCIKALPAKRAAGAAYARRGSWHAALCRWM